MSFIERSMYTVSLSHSVLYRRFHYTYIHWTCSHVHVLRTVMVTPTAHFWLERKLVDRNNWTSTYGGGVEGGAVGCE